MHTASPYCTICVWDFVFCLLTLCTSAPNSLQWIRVAFLWHLCLVFHSVFLRCSEWKNGIKSNQSGVFVLTFVRDLPCPWRGCFGSLGSCIYRAPMPVKEKECTLHWMVWLADTMGYEMSAWWASEFKGLRLSLHTEFHYTKGRKCRDYPSSAVVDLKRDIELSCIGMSCDASEHLRRKS